MTKSNYIASSYLKNVKTHHSEPEAQIIPQSVAGGMKHSRLKQRGFNWKKATTRALQHQLTRAIHLARCNPDYQIKYPNECRDNPESKILAECHVDAQKRIIDSHEKILKNSVVPVVDRPKRFSKVG